MSVCSYCDNFMRIQSWTRKTRAEILNTAKLYQNFVYRDCCVDIKTIFIEYS